MDYATQNYVETDQYEKSTNGIVGVRGAVKVCFSIRKAERVNLNEEFLSDAAVNGNSVLFRLNAWEIATFKIYI